jgi:DNA-binding SARP family transcriptional activator/tetratricopeptide (TPR) repeat protein
VEFRILGPPQVITPTGPVPLAGHRPLTVLSVLLVNHHRPVPLDYLVDAVWDDRPPATAKRQLQNCVSALRRQLAGGAAPSPSIIHAGPAGYEIRPGPGELDLQVFTDRVAQAQDLATEDRIADAATELRSALALWRGGALLGVRGRIVESVAAGLDEQRLAAIETCVDLELRLDRHDRLVAELTDLVAVHPLRERLVGQLMLALHRCGRQADALAAYHRLRTLLAEELGLDPGSQVQDIHATLLRNDRTEASRPPAGRRSPPPAQLPADVAGFTGRAEQLRALDELVPGDGGAATAVTIAVIAGTAGVGKTALAIHWGHTVRQRFPDGQLYVNLRGYSIDKPLRPIDALAYLLDGLGVPAEQIPIDVDTAANRYRTLLADRRVLVVLDNAATAEQVRPLLPASPGCLVLVTSRDRLAGLVARDGARGLAVDVLTAGEACDLLAGILGAGRVSAEPDATAALARSCTYLPLALRVAAAQLFHQPRSRIADQVAALGTADRLARLAIEGDEQAGVRDAFDLSYRSLDPDARRLFRLTGLVPGTGITAGAAAALSGSAIHSARTWLDQLAAAHLVGQPVPGRYASHDLLRQYAADRARQEDGDGEREAALGRLYDWYLHCADTAARTLYPRRLRLAIPPVTAATGPDLSEPAGALAWLDAERSNLVSAIRYAAESGPRPAAWLLADTLRGYFWLCMHTVDWLAAGRAGVVAADAEGAPDAQAAARYNLADALVRQSRYEQAAVEFGQALALAERVDWPQMRSAALGSLGSVHLHAGAPRTALSYLERALDLARQTGARSNEAVVLGGLGVAYRELGTYEPSVAAFQEAIAVFAGCGVRHGELAALGSLGETYHAMGRLEPAEDCLARAVAGLRELGDRGGESDLLPVLAAVELSRDRVDEAMRLATRTVTLAGEINDRRAVSVARNVLGAIHHRAGRYEQAATEYRGALELAAESGDHHPHVVAGIGVAEAYQGLGRADLAVRYARQALAQARAAEYRPLAERAERIVGSS